VEGQEPSTTDPLLSVSGLEVVYDGVVRAVRGVDLRVERGAVVALLGANGAGKSSTLRAITGLAAAHRGRVRGRIELDGRSLVGRKPAAIVRAGVSQVMEGRRIFAPLTVHENLVAGGFTVRDRRKRDEAYERVMTLFPVLAERRGQVAGYLSGGEQQMLAIGRALMQAPRLLLLDEPSLGLAPLVVEHVRDLIARINRTGTSILLVEQNAAMALGVAHHGYVMQNGGVAHHGPAADLLADDAIQRYYLGTDGGERVSYRRIRDEVFAGAPA
jgi:branched-chain amino acid transport system ATP-binding protein